MLGLVIWFVFTGWCFDSDLILYAVTGVVVVLVAVGISSLLDFA